MAKGQKIHHERIHVSGKMARKKISIQLCEIYHFGTYSKMGVSKNSGTPKWMIYNGNPY